MDTLDYVKKALQALDVPPHKRNDAQFLNACIVIASFWLEPVLESDNPQEREAPVKIQQPKEIARRYSETAFHPPQGASQETEQEPAPGKTAYQAVAAGYPYKLTFDLQQDGFELIPVERFKSMVNEEILNQDSGFGYPAIQRGRDIYYAKTRIHPGDELPEDADYIIWRPANLRKR